jgi:hypothetical protein
VWEGEVKSPNENDKEKKYEPFGKVAVKLGFCTTDSVCRALEIQKNLPKEQKEHKLIGMIMLEEGIISNQQLIAILKYYQDNIPV